MGLVWGADYPDSAAEGRPGVRSGNGFEISHDQEVGLAVENLGFAGLLSNQGENSINLFFIMVPSLRKSIKVWYSKAQLNDFSGPTVQAA